MVSGWVSIKPLTLLTLPNENVLKTPRNDRYWARFSPVFAVVGSWEAHDPRKFTDLDVASEDAGELLEGGDDLNLGFGAVSVVKFMGARIDMCRKSKRATTNSKT